MSVMTAPPSDPDLDRAYSKSVTLLQAASDAGKAPSSHLALSQLTTALRNTDWSAVAELAIDPALAEIFLSVCRTLTTTDSDHIRNLCGAILRSFDSAPWRRAQAAHRSRPPPRRSDLT